MWDDQIRFNLKISSEKAVFASNETKFESWLNLLLTFIFLSKYSDRYVMPDENSTCNQYSLHTYYVAVDFFYFQLFQLIEVYFNVEQRHFGTKIFCYI